MRKVTVEASLTYDVLIDKGILNRAGALCADVTKASRAVIITDSNVAPLYLGRVRASLEAAEIEALEFIIPAGEASKSAENYIKIMSFMAKERITRADVLVALGGGVVGDLAGFSAATYLRGIKYIQIPTTLLAMVDSSVGGKTAIDIPEGKNLVGAFYQPSLVICDPDTLSTLPESVFADGCAEVLKYGIINDKPLWEKLKAPILPQIEDIIENCVMDKRDVVNADERDVGVRQLLNLGHTPAHAIEILSDFEISHGSAVAMGTVIMARAAASLCLCPESDAREIQSLLASYGLPTECPFGAIELAAVATTDKKRAGDFISVILPHGIGNSKIHKIPVDELGSLFARGL